MKSSELCQVYQQTGGRNVQQGRRTIALPAMQLGGYPHYDEATCKKWKIQIRNAIICCTSSACGF